MKRDVGHEALLRYIASGSSAGDLPYLGIEANHFLPKTSLGTLINTPLSLGNRQLALSQIKSYEQSTDSSTLSPDSIDVLTHIFKKASNNITDSNLNMLAFNSQKKRFMNEFHRSMKFMGKSLKKQRL